MTDVKNLTVNLKANISDFDAKLKAARASLAKGTVATEALAGETFLLERLTRRLKNSYDGLTPSIKTTENRFKTAAAATEKTAKASKIAGGEIANIGYQINDIGVMLAAGQSPFVLAMQQGTQLSQVFERLKASGKSVGKAISGALSQVLSPLSLITIGLTFAVAQSTKWFNEWRSGSAPIMSVAEALKEVGEEIEELDQKILKLQEGTKTSAEATLRVDERRLRNKVKELEIAHQTATILSKIDDSESARRAERGLVSSTRRDLATARAELAEIQEQIALLQQQREEADKLERTYDSINETIASATIEREGYLAAERGVAEATRKEAATRASALQSLEMMGRGMEHYRDSSYMAAEATKTMADHKKKLAEKDIQLRKEAANEFASAAAAGQGMLYVERQILEARENAVNEALTQNRFLTEGAAVASRFAGEAEVMAQSLDNSEAAAAGVKYQTELAKEQALGLELAAGFVVDKMDGISASLESALPYADLLKAKLFAAGNAFFNALKVTSEGPGVDPLKSFGGFGEFKYGTASRFTPDKPGGGGGGSDPLAREFEALRERLLGQEELQLESFARQQEVLQNAYEQRLLTQQEYQKLMEEAQKQHSDRMAELNVYRHGDVLDQTSQWFGDMAGAFRSGNQQMVEVSRKFGAIEALINAYRAFNQTLANPELPWYAKIPAAAGVLAAGMNAVNAIKGGGAGGGGGAVVSSSASAVTSQRPLDVRLSGMSADEFISGASIQSLFDRLQDEAGDRGLRVSFA